MGRTPIGEDGAEADSRRQSPARARLKVGDDPDLRVSGGSDRLGFGLVGPAYWAA